MDVQGCCPLCFFNNNVSHAIPAECFWCCPNWKVHSPADSSLFRGGKDRLCPTEQHGKTRGGCPCVQPGGSPGLPTGEGCFTVSESTGTRWWQLKYFLFSTLPGEMIQFDSYFWKMGWFNHQVGKVVAFQHVERNSGDVKMVDSKRALFPETVSVC